MYEQYLEILWGFVKAFVVGGGICMIAQIVINFTDLTAGKILVLFISMTLLSIFLDELGFFRFLASVALKRAGKNQFKLFFLLYATVSVLTVFTSNDIIILSFTPFVCYFAKNARINPLPYLAAEFVAANTWSMALIIGNPTNIYLVTAAGGDFSSYPCIGCCCLPLPFPAFQKEALRPHKRNPRGRGY